MKFYPAYHVFLLLVLLTSSSGVIAAPKGCVSWDAKSIHEKAAPYKKNIVGHARKYKVDANLIIAVITVESCYNKKAISPKGAQGLMQLMPDTAERYGVSDSFNASQNIRGGTQYLRFLLSRYQGDLSKVVAAYNAGEGRVDYYNGIPPYKETRNYVRKVLEIYKRLSPQKKAKKPAIKSLGAKPGRQGWQYLKARAPHLFKQ
jgi:soluble lytic murein transglycosylase-like protein